MTREEFIEQVGWHTDKKYGKAYCEAHPKTDYTIDEVIEVCEDHIPCEPMTGCTQLLNGGYTTKRYKLQSDNGSGSKI